jgi:hypothetical protein
MPADRNELCCNSVVARLVYCCLWGQHLGGCAAFLGSSCLHVYQVPHGNFPNMGLQWQAAKDSFQMTGYWSHRQQPLVSRASCKSAAAPPSVENSLATIYMLTDCITPSNMW